MQTAPLISAEELLKSINNETLVIIDARTGPGVKEKYSASHIRGAIFVDLETQLSKKSENAANGGRHPLPPVKDFAALLGSLGIGTSTHVVVYDDKSGGNAAARFWWMMKAVGHNNIQVLDGGLQAAIAAGVPLTSDLPDISPNKQYPATEWLLPLVDINTVAHATVDPNKMVIDVREAYRYNGESEPIDTVAGHIPGAVNIPYISNLDAEGKFLPADELKKKYQDALGQRAAGQVIVHCGSGVTACHTLLALNHAGLELPNLYIGSWSEWSRNDQPIASNE